MQHLSLKENAYKIIKEKIFRGEFKPGERIREDMLADEISMSRTPVREAINQLSAEGLVRNVTRKGVYFVEFSAEELIDLLDVRESLETLAVVRCIEKINPEQLNRLKSILDEFELMLSKEKYQECNELDSRFHREIAAISGNSKLIKFLSEIEEFMAIARFVEKKASPDAKNRLTFREHSEIFDCIRKKDKTGAIQAVKENIKRMKKNLGINS